MPELDEEELEQQQQEEEELDYQSRAQELEAYNQQQRRRQQQSSAQPGQSAADTVKKVRKLWKWSKRIGFVISALGTIWFPLLLTLFIAGAFIGGCNSSTSFRFASLGVCEPFIFKQISPPPSPAAPTAETGQPIGNDLQNRTLLAQYGITVNKKNCVTTTQTNCTSLDRINSNVVNEIIQVAQACDVSLGGNGKQNKCSVQVTGGSEAGHAESGTCTHSNGYKMDVSAAATLTAYIQKNFTYQGGRGGSGAGAQYFDPSITSSFVLESTPAHWDISVGCIG